MGNFEIYIADMVIMQTWLFLGTNLRSYFRLTFIIADLGNLYPNLGSYFHASFIMTTVGNCLQNVIAPMPIISSGY